MKYLRQTLLALLYLLPAVLFFSYYPIIRLGSNSSMNFELSLPLIWLVIFDIVAFISLVVIWYHQCTTSSTSKQPSTATLQKHSHPRTTDSIIVTSQQHPRHHGVQQHSSHFLESSLRLPGLSDRRFFLFALFPLYITISILWSANPLRGLLTAGIAWLIFFAVFAIINIVPLLSPPSTLRRNVLLSLVIFTTFVCFFCFLQSILDLLGLSRASTLLCAGCTYRSFGFPHPSGFAIEPQFMGNLLLAPTLTMLYLLVTQPSSQDSKNSSQQPANPATFSRWRNFWPLAIIVTLFSTTLFFTFSRGAIYAYAIALIVMLILCLKRHHFRWSLITIPVLSFLISLGLQGTFSALSPTSETFISGVTKSIHQLSLGIIDLRPQEKTSPVENSEITVDNSATTVDNSTQNVENPATSSGKPVENPTPNGGNPAQNSPHGEEDSPTSSPETNPPTSTGNDEVYFEGYVPESTNIRLNLNKTAIDTWLAAPGHPRIEVNIGCAHKTSGDPTICLTHTQLTPTSILFGVGLGGAGTAMHAAFPDIITSSKEIVQNEFFSLLLETGLVGVALLIFSFLLAFAPRLFSAKFLDGRAANSRSRSATFWHHPALPLLLSLVIAYLITLNFFSGLPNALQIYLMPPLIYLIFQEKSCILSESAL